MGERGERKIEISKDAMAFYISHLVVGCCCRQLGEKKDGFFCHHIYNFFLLLQKLAFCSSLPYEIEREKERK
jgi:hypothetical protein